MFGILSWNIMLGPLSINNHGHGPLTGRRRHQIFQNHKKNGFFSF